MFSLLAAGCLLASVPQDSVRLAVIQKAAPFNLTDQNGTALKLDDLKGQVLLVGFIFTTCNGSCPATTHRMAQVQEELRKRGLLKDDKVRLLSISLDPERDTPDAVRRYIQLYDLDMSTWSFLIGPAERIRSTISSWGMWTRPSANSQLDHPSRVFLVDGEGNIREIYNLSFLKSTWVADDIEALLK